MNRSNGTRIMYQLFVKKYIPEIRGCPLVYKSVPYNPLCRITASLFSSRCGLSLVPLPCLCCQRHTGQLDLLLTYSLKTVTLVQMVSPARTLTTWLERDVVLMSPLRAVLAGAVSGSPTFPGPLIAGQKVRMRCPSKFLKTV